MLSHQGQSALLSFGSGTDCPVSFRCIHEASFRIDTQNGAEYNGITNVIGVIIVSSYYVEHREHFCAQIGGKVTVDVEYQKLSGRWMITAIGCGHQNGSSQCEEYMGAIVENLSGKDSDPTAPQANL